MWLTQKGTFFAEFCLRRIVVWLWVRGIQYILMAFIDALYLTHEKPRTLFKSNSVRNKVTIDAYGYDVHTCSAVLSRQLSYRRRFHCCLFTSRYAKASFVISNKWGLRLLFMYAKAITGSMKQESLINKKY